MTLHGPFTSSGLALDPPDAVESNPLRALDAALRQARAAAHERRLDPPVARALAATLEAVERLRDAVLTVKRGTVP